MYWISLKILSSVIKLGKNRILVVDLRDNGLASERWVETVPIFINDSLKYNGDRYIVKGIEAYRNLLNLKISATIGLIVKKI